MATRRRPVKRSRAYGVALTPKAQRYMESRPYPPGDHGRKRRRAESDYRVRLREKQRLRAQYDIGEAQLRRIFAGALRLSGKTGERLLVELERRLDAFVMRAGLARTIYQARQFVSHGHVTVNGGKVDRPSYRLSPGDTVSVRPASRTKVPFLVAVEGGLRAADPPAYIDVDQRKLTATLRYLPPREEIPVLCEEQLVVEHYSR